MYLVMKGIDFKRILADLKTANYFWVVLGMIVGLIAFVARAYRWNLLIEPLGYRPSVKNSYHAVAIGYIANIALPRLGEFSKCVSLNRTNRIPVDSLVGTILIERAIDIVTLFFLLIVIFVGMFETFGKFISDKILIPLYTQLSSMLQQSSNFLIIGIVVFASLIILAYVFRKQLAKIHLLRKIKKIVFGVIGGLKTVYKMQKRWQFFAATIVIWTCYFLMTYLIFFSIPETSHLRPIDGLFILIIGSFGMIIPVQGGFGAFHGMIILGLSLYGITMDKAFVYAVLSHESQTLMVIIAGAVSLIKVFSSPHIRKNVITPNDRTMDYFALLQSKIVYDYQELANNLAYWKFKNLKIVFTNGCFDILHRGHVEYLAKAASLADVMVVGLNTDSSVTRLKGVKRPVQDETSRAHIIASLACVSKVVLFDEDTPFELIKFIQPDVLVKGSDYKAEDIVGYDIVKAKGGDIVTIDIVDGYSTTAIVRKLIS